MIIAPRFAREGYALQEEGQPILLYEGVYASKKIQKGEMR